MQVPEPDATWGVDFARTDGTGGFLRLLRFGHRCWAWAYLVGPSIGLVVVRDTDVAPPRRTEIIDVRGEGLWMEMVCETRDEHWSYGVEAFAVRLDDPADALHGEIGERLPMGVDLEWETDGSSVTGSVHGELVVGAERIDLDACVRRADADAVGGPREWPEEWSARRALVLSHRERSLDSRPPASPTADFAGAAASALVPLGAAARWMDRC